MGDAAERDSSVDGALPGRRVTMTVRGMGILHVSSLRVVTRPGSVGIGRRRSETDRTDRQANVTADPLLPPFPPRLP